MLNELDTGFQHTCVQPHLVADVARARIDARDVLQNQICIWKYPMLNMVASLTVHINRVLDLAMRPDGETRSFLRSEGPESCQSLRRVEGFALSHLTARTRLYQAVRATYFNMTLSIPPLLIFVLVISRF
ncbi:hypothetical protein C0992_006360 [Termitomyces sp. T32_za158]|nr:hypothetical protein C0992_006360 [Termitomyces sp. T32_za158]